MRASGKERVAGALERGEDSRGGNGERREGPEKRKKIKCKRRRETNWHS